MIGRRGRFAAVVASQLDLYVREHADALADVAARLDAYNDATADDAEELYGDYVDAVDAAVDALGDLRDHYAATLDDPERYVDEFDRAARRRLPELATGLAEAP